MSEVKVARDHYHRMSPNGLHTFSLGIRDGVYIINPAKFPTPPMIQTDFEDIIEDFENKRTAFVTGGDAQKGPYLDALKKLMDTLDDFADMVDGITDLTTATILESGFTATKEVSSEHHIPDGTRGVINLRRGDATGVIHAECTVVPEAELYQAIISDAPLTDLRIENSRYLETGKTGIFVRIDLSKSRKKTFEGLTPGKVYWVYYWIGNSKGVSMALEGKSIMAA